MELLSAERSASWLLFVWRRQHCYNPAWKSGCSRRQSLLPAAFFPPQANKQSKQTVRGSLFSVTVGLGSLFVPVKWYKLQKSQVVVEHMFIQNWLQEAKMSQTPVPGGAHRGKLVGAAESRRLGEDQRAQRAEQSILFLE